MRLEGNLSIDHRGYPVLAVIQRCGAFEQSAGVVGREAASEDHEIDRIGNEPSNELADDRAGKADSRSPETGIELFQIPGDQPRQAAVRYAEIGRLCHIRLVPPIFEGDVGEAAAQRVDALGQQVDGHELIVSRHRPGEEITSGKEILVTDRHPIAIDRTIRT